MQRRLAGLLLLAASGTACASAINYLDPSSPLYVYPREGPSAPATAESPLRVVSFNIAYAIEIDRAIAVLRVTGALRDSDVLALQEMDAPGTERIARALGMNAVYFPSGVHPKHDRDFGCAILSPWPLDDDRKLLLPHRSRVIGQGRAAVTARVLVAGRRRRRRLEHARQPSRKLIRIVTRDSATMPSSAIALSGTETSIP